MGVFTGDPTHIHRSSDRIADWASIIMGIFASVVGVVALASEVIYRIGVGFGLLVGTAGREHLWGIWTTLAIFTSCGLVAAAFFAGTPKDIGIAFLKAFVERFGKGRGGPPAVP